MKANTFLAAQTHWVHNLSPFLVRFTENIGIRYYGLAYVAGFLWATLMLWLYHRKGRSPLNSDQQADCIFAIVLGVIIGSRLGYFIFYDFAGLLGRPWILFEVWKGGMSSHGGFIGIGLALWWTARRAKIGYWELVDIFSSFGGLGLFFGRIANFVNGELWGKASDAPWAVIFPRSAEPGTPVAQITPRHPSQLYEAAAEGLLMVIFTQWRFWKSGATKRPGSLTGEMLVFYSIARIVCEQFREPDASLFFGVSRGAFYSLFMLAIGIWLILRPLLKKQPMNKP